MFSDIRLLAPDTNKHVVIFMHGIRDDGSWVHEVISQQWREAAIIHTVSIGNINVGDFVKRVTHDESVNSAKKQIRTIQKKYKGHPISIVCHSYGTNILLSCVNQLGKFSTIVLVASVCKLGAAEIFAKRAEKVVNYCGSRDIWPLVASMFNGNHYGCTGIFGFNQTAYVLDLIYDHGHSDGISASHLNHQVFPGIIYGQFERTSRPPKTIPHWWERFADNRFVGPLLILYWFGASWPYRTIKRKVLVFWKSLW